MKLARGVPGPDWTKCVESRNPMNELAFLRATFKGLIDMSEELGLDASRRSAWQEHYRSPGARIQKASARERRSS